MTSKFASVSDIRVDTRDMTLIEPVDEKRDADGFVYIVSHDLRHCARALNEVPQWFREDLDKQRVVLGADAEANLELLERHARRLDRMLLDILVYSRVGRLQQVAEISLRDLIDDVLAELPLPDHVTLHTDEDLPDMCMGYRDAFTMVKCVLENAVKHGDPVGVALWISGSRQDDMVTLTFTDNGPGVADTDIQRIFRPMTTLRRRDEVEGSGLGLTILHKIADHYDGAIWAGRGADGRGFRLRLQLKMATMSEAQAGGLAPVIF